MQIKTSSRTTQPVFAIEFAMGLRDSALSEGLAVMDIFSGNQLSYVLKQRNESVEQGKLVDLIGVLRTALIDDDATIAAALPKTGNNTNNIIRAFFLKEMNYHTDEVLRYIDVWSIHFLDYDFNMRYEDDHPEMVTEDMPSRSGIGLQFDEITFLPEYLAQLDLRITEEEFLAQLALYLQALIAVHFPQFELVDATMIQRKEVTTTMEAVLTEPVSA